MPSQRAASEPQTAEAVIDSAAGQDPECRYRRSAFRILGTPPAFMNTAEVSHE